jgi:radical SAM protein with 4Fe4S-binding SPASM domain
MRDKERFKGERMSFAVFQKLIERYKKDQAKNTGELEQRLSIVFHGGEPTLLETRELRRFMNYAKRRVPYVSFSMQTNLINISEEMALLLQEYKITPGISVDGYNFRLNKMRTGFRKTTALKNRHWLDKCYNVTPGPLMVVNKDNINGLLVNIRRLCRRLNIGYVRANYVENVYAPDNTAPEVTAAELLQHLFVPMARLFLRKGKTIERNSADIITNFIKCILFGRYNGSAWQDAAGAHCNAKFCAGGNKLAEVDAEGHICFCGRWDDVHEICTLGSLTDTDLWGLSSYYKAWTIQRQKSVDIRAKHCDKCRAASICDYGCVAFAYSKHGRIHIREELVCAYFQQVYDYLLAHCTPLLLRFARREQWPIAYHGKNSVWITLPDSYPQLNPQTVSTVPCWSIVPSGKSTVLKVDM